MGPSKVRSTRKLRSWMVEQVSSGRYPGLVWEDEDKTMFRIPWKHAGKQDFRSDEDAAIFKAWAEFKGKMTEESRKDPATWKTRLRCALNKSKEFQEVADRSQLDISDPYKVYRLVPVNEQDCEANCNEGSEPQRGARGARAAKKTKTRATVSSDEDEVPQKLVKEESVTPPLCVEDILLRALQTEHGGQPIVISQEGGIMEEFQLDFRIETNPAPTPAVEDSFRVAVSYSGQEVLSQEVLGTDVRIAYHKALPLPPTPASLMSGFPRISFPEPAAGLPGARELHALLPCMERGVALTSNNTGVYVTRFCQGRVFWVGPHATAAPGASQKIQCDSQPVLIFSKETFRQQLEAYRQAGGEPPVCNVVLCFGEELLSTDDLTRKLIIAKITFPWAEKQVQNVESMFSFIESLTSQTQNGEITINLVPMEEAIYPALV